MRGPRSSRSFLTLAIALAALCITPCRALAAPDNGDIAGVVRDSTSGEPLANAELSVTRDGRVVVNAESDQFGHFVMHNIPAGEYAMSARMIGYRAKSRAITVTAGERLTLTFTLAPVAT